jgi:hypothetical protein
MQPVVEQQPENDRAVRALERSVQPTGRAEFAARFDRVGGAELTTEPWPLTPLATDAWEAHIRRARLHFANVDPQAALGVLQELESAAVLYSHFLDIARAVAGMLDQAEEETSDSTAESGVGD